MDDQQQFEAWGLIELFGHNKLAGRITEQTIGGCHFIRVDVPAVGDIPEYTRCFTQGAIYGLTFTSEDVARRLAAGLQARPIMEYQLQVNPQGRLPYDDEGDDYHPMG